MTQHYSRPSRESDTYSLPDVETFRANYADCLECTTTTVEDGAGEYRCDSCSEGRKGFEPEKEDVQTGWFYWFCFPGCMPDSEPMGPYATEEEALADAREGMDDEAAEGDSEECSCPDPDDAPNPDCPEHGEEA